MNLGSGPILVHTGPGNDVIYLGAGKATVQGGDGDDMIVVTDRSEVQDVIDGGAGIDILRITDGDVDISAATLSNLERIEANSSSLTLTQTQFDQLQSLITGSAGLVLKMASPGKLSLDGRPQI